MSGPKLSSEFLTYLASAERYESDSTASIRLPALTDLSTELGLSVSCLREQVEVAEALGLVEVRPRTGIRRLPYTFLPAVRESLSYAIALDREHFEEFSDLRNHIESSYWYQATLLLTEADKQELQRLTSRAFEKLRGQPIQIPHSEHRRLHLGIFKRLDNTFVLGLLEAYWEAYEAVGLNVYADYYYHQEVWTYHQRMVDSIISGDFETGYKALVEHKDLLYHRPYHERVVERNSLDTHNGPPGS